MLRVSILLLASFVAACGAAPAPLEPANLPRSPVVSRAQPSATPVAQEVTRPAYMSEEDRLTDAAVHAPPGPRRVLETARTMISEGTIIRGSCWDWVNEVFTRSQGETQRIFGARITGPFADTSLIQPGDWIYLNHVPEGGTHSAIFVAWTDAPLRVALMVSYAGGRSNSPGRFGEYDLSAVYRVMRLGDEVVVPRPPRRPHRHHSR